MLHDLAQDVRIALRTFLARPVFTAAAVLTVALAIGANTVLFGVLRGVVLRPPPYRSPDRLVAVWPNHFLGYREVRYLREHARTLGEVGAWVPGWNMTLTGSGEAAKLAGARVTANLFAVLGISPAAGRGFLAAEETPGADDAVLLSFTTWRTRFGGDRSLVGRRIMLDGTPHTVVGIMPEGFELYQPRTQVWRVLANDPSEWYQRGGALFAIARLAPRTTVDQARAELRRLMGGMREAFGRPADYGADADVAPLQDWLVGPLRPMLFVAAGAVAFVLLLAGANLAGLLLARAAGREREIAVRTALGARRGRLLRQLLTESTLLAAVGGTTGIALSLWGLGAATRLLPAETPFMSGIRLDGVVLAVSAVVVIGTGIVFGLAPALASLGHGAQQALRGARGVGIGRTGARTRGALVAGEVAIAMVLLVGAALMIETLWRLQHVDPGFRAHEVLTLQLQPTGARFREPAQRVTYYGEVFDRLAALPGVRSVGAIQHLPLSGTGWGADVEIEGRPLPAGATPPRVAWRIVAGDYARAMGIPLVAGRVFGPRDRADAPAVALVNQSMARRLWPGESPLGRRIRAGNATGGAWATIVGVLGDVRHDGLGVEPAPELYQPFAQNPLGGMTVVVHCDAPEELARAAVGAVRDMDPDVPITAVQTMDDVARASMASNRTVLDLLGAFALVGLVLGIVGIYGVVAHHVAARTRDIGVRIALGAVPGSVVRASLVQGARLAAAGVAMGGVLALLLGRWLQAFVFATSPSDPLTLTVAAAARLGWTRWPRCAPSEPRSGGRGPSSGKSSAAIAPARASCSGRQSLADECRPQPISASRRSMEA